ncbi:Dynein light chain [Gnomoniopsis smithogilvyi]|uniref:Dynein light chain n=1 Tax=Gnomoniopsis smithogilvyi TaxID=1191159 RepID=A0A9W8Z4R0_9PEZI|nr:Dynein light chain [Gnomoniopsis smithogilvyi]
MLNERETRVLETTHNISSPLKIPSVAMVEAGATSPSTREKQLDAQIKSADMTEELSQEVIEVAQEAMAKFTIEKDIAQHIKKTFDERKGPTWHCIVGRNFGSFVTHETKHFIYFYLGHCAILLFKTQ